MGKWLRGVLLVFIIIIPLVFLAGWYQSAPHYHGKVSEHFDGEKFINQIETHQNRGSFFWWLLTNKKKPWPQESVTIKNTGHKDLPANKMLVTYINHATTLIQTSSITVITDPIWSKRAGPFKYLGPKRIHNPGMELKDLPKIDVVLISHNHYDHLDIPTLKKLNSQFSPVFIVGLGNKAILNKVGIDNVIELDWWEKTSVKGVPIHFVPAVHFSSRGFYDKDRTLWGGFVFPSKKGYVYISGDTGWGPHFQDIANKFQPIALSVLPIGSYEPQWFMKPFHINPEEAVQAHLLLKSKQSLGIHWGTFRVSNEMRFEPIWDLKIAMGYEYITPNSFQALPPGASLEL
jgi:L-ascorbate metabolism protein UlaG (beta-lactamase superfamily)